MTFRIWGTEDVVRQGAGSSVDRDVVAHLPNGGYVVGWRSANENKIFFQLYDGAGAKVGGMQAVVSDSATALQTMAEIKAVGTDGQFAISWNESAGTPGSSAIKTRVFDVDGTPLTQQPVTLASNLALEGSSAPSIARAGNNGFVTVYDDGDSIQMAIQDLNGNVTDTILIATGVGLQSPDVMVMADGRYVVTYAIGSGGTQFKIVDGFASPATDVGGNGQYSDVVAAGNNGFAVIYSTGANVMARFYNMAGTPGALATLTTEGLADGDFVSATALRDGRVAVVYIATNAGDNGDVFLRVVNPDGTMTEPLLLNEGAARDGTGQQYRPSVTEMWDGRVSVTWHDPTVGNGKISTQIVDVRTAAVVVNGTARNDVYAGSDYDGNVLNGGAGNDKLIAGSGSDIFDGGDGIDVVSYERAAAGVVADLAAGGAVGDARGDTYAKVENLRGSSFNDTLYGNAGNNHVAGAGGNDVITGGGGADTLDGGAGDDTYFLDGGDTVIEAAGGGHDTIMTSANFNLNDAPAVENVVATGGAALTFVGNDLSNTLTGNTGADRLEGGGGDDVLNGSVGADAMLGGLGNDTYYVDNVGDQVVETSAGAGRDRILTEVSYSLGSFVDDLFGVGSGSLVLKGNTSANTIAGSAGWDKLYGNLGKDVLSGGAGKDTFVFNTKVDKQKLNVDKITDYNVRDDTVWLDNKYFKKLGKKGTETKPALLKKDFFTIGTKAKDGNDYVVYDNKKGILYYDADGSGNGAAIQIATLNKKLKMTYKDFFVV